MSQLRAAQALLIQQPAYALVALPLVLAIASRHFAAIAGAILIIVAAALALRLGLDEHDQVALAAVLGLAGLCVALMGFQQRRLIRLVRDLDRRQSETERRVADDRERQLLQALRSRNADAGPPTLPRAKEFP